MPAPRAIVSLYSDIGGTGHGGIPYLAGQRHRRRLDGRDKWEFEAADGPWRLNVERRRSVVKVELPYAGTFYWRVFGMKIGKGPRGVGTVHLTCEPLSLILRDAGRMRIQLGGAGGGWNYSLGSKRATPRFYLETFAFPQVHRRGATWFQLGDVENDGLYDIKWYGKTGQWLLEEVKRITGLEQEVEHVSPTVHWLHLRKRVGEDAAEVLIADGRNLVAAIQTQTGQGYANVAAGFGLVPEGSTERATMGLAAWRVAAVNTGTHTVSLEDRNEGDPPDLLDNQSQGLYLRAIDGTLHLIVSTVASDPNVFQLETGHAGFFTVDDDVEIRLDADGSLRDELRDPEATVEVAESFERDYYRGERNYALNPFGLVFPDKPDSLGVQSDGFHSPSGTTLNVENVVPSNRTIPDGSLVAAVVAPTTMQVVETQGATVASGGDASMTIAPALPPNNDLGGGPLPDNTPLVIYEGPAKLPSRWSAPQAGTQASPIVAYYPTGLADLEGSAVIADLRPDGRFTVTGLGAYEGTPDGEIYPGDALCGPDGWSPILARATVVSGQVVVTCGRNSAQLPLAAAAPGTFPVTIYRLRIPGDRPQAAVTVLIGRKVNTATGGITLAPQVDTDEVAVTPIPGLANALVVVEATIRGTLGLGLSGPLVAPRVEVFDGGVLFAQGAPDAPISMPVGPFPIDHHVVLKTLVPIHVARALSVRFHGAGLNSTSFLGQFITALRSFSIQVGSEDENAGAAWPSHANQIHQDANRQLMIARSLTEEWGFEISEFWQRFGATPAEPKVVLGGSLFARTSLNGNQGMRFRFTEVDHALDDPAKTRFKALSRVIEAMELINRRLGQKEASSGAIAGGTLVLPAGGTSAGTGGAGAAGTGSIHIGRSDARPRANHRGDYLHEQDTLDVTQWFGNAWDEIVEATRGDLRVATTRGAELAMCEDLWEHQRQRWTTDDQGERLLLPVPES